MLDYLNQEVEKLSIESNQKKCKHIYKIFKYLEDAKTERDKEQILMGLKKTYKICNTKLKKSKSSVYLSTHYVINLCKQNEY